MKTEALDTDGEPFGDDAAAADGKETITLYELPPIFCSGIEEDDRPTLEKIEVVFVSRKLPSKELSYVDWKPIENLCDVSQLLEIFGPGTYRLQGRAVDRRHTIKQAFLTVGDDAAEVVSHRDRLALERGVRGEFDLTKLATSVVAVASPIIGLLTSLMDRRDAARLEERRRDDERRADERQREDARNQAFMSTMSGLMKARNEDLEHMVKDRATIAAPPGAKLSEAYKEGQADAFEMLRSFREEGLGVEDIESRVLGIIESFAAGKRKGEAQGVGDDGATVLGGGENGAAS